MVEEQSKNVFQYVINSNAAPFFSDRDSGFIEATDPMTALKEVVRNYKRPAGLFAAVIKEPTPKNPVVARYLSARAATQAAAPSGETEWRKDSLYVNNKKVPEKQEVYELVE